MTNDAQRALVSVMIIASAADGHMTEAEWRMIEANLTYLPVFEGFETASMHDIADHVAVLLGEEDGLERALSEVRAVLPPRLHETAYALAVEIAAADGKATQEELEFLTDIRYALDISRLHASAIEHAAKIRHRVMPEAAST